jgi:CheY-like chemotaxis protein
MKMTSTRVLVVDDHADSLECAARLLRKLGYATLTANSCAAARSLARAGAVDVVVSDVGLPDGDGIALLEELKARHGIASVALTGHVMPADVRRYDRADIDCYLAKPNGIVELSRVVEKLTGAVVRSVKARRSA